MVLEYEKNIFSIIDKKVLKKKIRNHMWSQKIGQLLYNSRE